MTVRLLALYLFGAIFAASIAIPVRDMVVGAFEKAASNFPS